MVKKFVLFFMIGLLVISSTGCTGSDLPEGVEPYPNIPMPEGNGGEHFPPGSSYWPEPDLYAPYTWGELALMEDGGVNVAEVVECAGHAVIAEEDEWSLVSCGDPTLDDFASALFLPIASVGTWGTAPLAGERIIALLLEGEMVLGFVVVSSLTLYAAGTALAYNGGHSNPAHNPNIPGSWANQQVWWLIASWAGLIAVTNGNGPRCGQWQDDGGRIKRYVYWVPRPDFSNGNGLLVWAFAKAGGVLGDFGGAYGAPASSAGRVVQSLADRGWRYISVPCRSMPNPGNFNLPPGPPAFGMP